MRLLSEYWQTIRLLRKRLNSKEALVKTQVGDCSSIRCSSPKSVASKFSNNVINNCVFKSCDNMVKRNVIDSSNSCLRPDVDCSGIYRTMFIYNSTVKRSQVGAALVFRIHKQVSSCCENFNIKSRIFRTNTRPPVSGEKHSSEQVVHGVEECLAHNMQHIDKSLGGQCAQTIFDGNCEVLPGNVASLVSVNEDEMREKSPNNPRQRCILFII